MFSGACTSYRRHGHRSFGEPLGGVCDNLRTSNIDVDIRPLPTVAPTKPRPNHAFAAVQNWERFATPPCCTVLPIPTPPSTLEGALPFEGICSAHPVYLELGAFDATTHSDVRDTLVDTGAAPHIEVDKNAGFADVQPPHETITIVTGTSTTHVALIGTHVQYLVGIGPDYTVVRDERHSVFIPDNFSRPLYSERLAYRNNGVVIQFAGCNTMTFPCGTVVPFRDTGKSYLLTRYFDEDAAQDARARLVRVMSTVPKSVPPSRVGGDEPCNFTFDRDEYSIILPTVEQLDTAKSEQPTVLAMLA